MCDSLCRLEPDGLLFAKNSDRPPDEVQVVRSFPRRVGAAELRTQYLTIPDQDAAAFVGSQPTWLWGVEHGVNEHGVAIGNEKIWTAGNVRSRPPALLGMDLVRLGLERSRTAEEALGAMTGLVERHGQGGSGERDHDEPYDSSFLIADPASAWVLETCDRTWVAKPVERGAAISNRVSLTTDWTSGSPDVAPGTDFQAWRNPKVPTAIADHRLAATTRCVDAAVADPATVAAALRDHGTGSWGTPRRVTNPVAPSDRPAPIPGDLGEDYAGVTVCMHVRGMQATTASMVAWIPREARATTRLWIALGSPCASVFVPTFPGVGVPSALSDPTVWLRFTRLRDRAERDTDALGAIRDGLGPTEALLWEEAGRIDDRDGNAQQAFTTAASARIDDALVDLGV